MAVASATKESLHKSGPSPSRSSKQEAESAPETSSVHSGYASNRRDVDIVTSGSEEYRLLFRLPLDEDVDEDIRAHTRDERVYQRRPLTNLLNPNI